MMILEIVRIVVVVTGVIGVGGGLIWSSRLLGQARRLTDESLAATKRGEYKAGLTQSIEALQLVETAKGSPIRLMVFGAACFALNLAITVAVDSLLPDAESGVETQEAQPVSDEFLSDDSPS